MARLPVVVVVESVLTHYHSEGLFCQATPAGSPAACAFHPAPLYDWVRCRTASNKHTAAAAAAFSDSTRPGMGMVMCWPTAASKLSDSHACCRWV